MTGGMSADAASKYMLEYLDRGICAVNTGSGMLVSWRYLANDDDNAVYKLYRDGTLVYTSEAGKSTCYLDASGNFLKGEQDVSASTGNAEGQVRYAAIRRRPYHASGNGKAGRQADPGNFG